MAASVPYGVLQSCDGVSFGSQSGTLIDFQPSNREVWGVWWRREGGGQEEESLVQRAVYDR